MSGEMVELKRMATVTYGLSQPPPLADEGVPIVRATNIKRGRIIARELIFAALEQLPLDRVPLLRAGELLVVRSGAYTGDSALVTPEWEYSSPGYDLRVTPTPALEPRFTAYSLQGGVALDHMVLASSRAAQPHLNSEDLGEVPILRLAPREQGAIADFLDIETARIDALITKKRRMIRVIDERKQVRVAASFTSLDVGPSLGRVASVRSGAGFPHEHQGAESGQLPFIKVSDLASGSDDAVWVRRAANYIGTDTARLLGSRPAEPGAVIFPKVGAALLGNARRLVAQPSAFDNNLMVVQSEAHEPRFLRYWFTLLDLGELANPGPVPSVNESVIKALRPPLPPPSVQARLADDLDVMCEKAAATTQALRRQIALLEEHRQALITAAVTGELEPPGVAA